MTPTHPIHLVGSIGLADTKTVFETLSSLVGARAFYYPDGETGARTNWVMWQGQVFADHPDIVEDGLRNPLVPGLPSSPQYKPTTDELDFGSVGYAKEALRSYALFSEMKKAGTIPPTVRFQVSLPTPTAVVASFVSPDHCASVHSAYVAAMKSEVAEILKAVPHDELALQWDTAVEVIAYDGGPPLHLARPLEDTVALIADLSNTIPEAVHLGYHLCYGDPGHQHVVEPQDLATSVKFANAICGAVERRSDFVHMAVPRDRTDDAYFAPLKDLRIGETRLALGLVHYTDGIEGTRNRLATAEKHASSFSIATECGFGRRDPETIPDLLRIHTELSA